MGKSKPVGERRLTRSVNPTHTESETIERAVALEPGRSFSRYVIESAVKRADRELRKAQRPADAEAPRAVESTDL